jgi:hypothetical protein
MEVIVKKIYSDEELVIGVVVKMEIQMELDADAIRDLANKLIDFGMQFIESEDEPITDYISIMEDEISVLLLQENDLVEEVYEGETLDEILESDYTEVI